MKKNICICAFLFFAFSGFGQVVDTAAVVREVDSLIKISQKFIKQAEYEKALEISAAVEVLASGKLGKESAAYGNVCYNRGLILFYKGRYREAETWYLESVTIRQKIYGEEHKDYAESLNSLAIIYYYLQKFEKAEPLYLKAIAIQEKVLGKEHTDYGRSLNNLANLYMSMGNYEAAERLMLESIDIKRKVSGKENTDVAVVILNLGNLYSQMRAYEKAEPLFMESKAILEKTVGKEHAYYAVVLNYLANTYQALSKYEAAESLYLESIDIWEKKPGKDHPNYARNLYDLGFLYYRQEKYSKAVPVWLECLAIRKKVLGTEHQDYLASVTALGGVYQIMGQYELAEPLFLESIALLEKKVGKDHPQYLAALYSLASVYFRLGNFQDAESLFLEIKSIRKKTLGSVHPDYAQSLNSLGVFYNTIGESKKAEYFFLEALSIQDSVLDNKHYDRTNTLHNLAVLYRKTSEFVKSESLFREVLTHYEEQKDTSTSSYAGSLIDLATLYKDLGKYEEAETLLLKARDIFENHQKNREHVFYLVGLAHLAGLYIQRCEYDKAEQLILEVLSLREKAMGTHHPNYSALLNNLGLLYWKTGKTASATQYLDRDIDLVKSLVSAAARHLSQQEMAAYIQTFQISLDQYFSFSQAHLNVAAGSADVCFNNILFYKGFLLNAADKIRNQYDAGSKSNETINLLKATNRLLANEYAKSVSQRGKIMELEEQANALEKELANTVNGFGDAIRQVSWQEVQSALRPNEAALEFIHFNYYNPETTDSILYAALLLKPGMQHPMFIPLCEEKQLKALLPAADGKLNNDQVNELYSNDALYRLLWRPLESHLTDVRKVYYSPSGLLHRLNLVALPASPKAILSDRHEMVSLGSTRQLALDNQNAVPSEAPTALIYGGIQFDMDSMAYPIRPANRTGGQRGLSFAQTDSTLRGGTWDFLKWSEREADNIQAALGQAGINAQVVKGRQATEESFKQIGHPESSGSPRILHISTHGFFFPAPASNPKSETRNLLLEEPVFKLSDHPMIRSGLILAGANHAWKTGRPLGNREDGILTAYEISQLDLRNTELVVLSACETGLGHIEGNEGVYGLQRAFKIAGAKTLVMSLWQVPDYQTQELMTAFYQKWLPGSMSVRQAMQATQKEMRDKGYEPYYWAGFVVVE